MNKTQIHFNDTDEQINKITGWEVAVFDAATQAQLTPWASVSPSRDSPADPLTATLPASLFAVAGVPDGSVRIGIRGNNTGGPGLVGFDNPPFNVVWQPIAPTDVTVS